MLTLSRRAKLAIALLGSMTATTMLNAAEDSPAKQASDLPLGRVVLFSSGVGFYEHDGEVTDDAKVELKFNVDDVNDLLKSMVLQDLGGGKVSTVTYGSKEPITKALQTFAIDLTDNPTMASLLQQIRGEKVQVETATPVTGTIIGIERRKVKIKEDELEEQELLILLTSTGLRKVDLATATSVKLLDDKLNAELQKALEVLALGHSTDRKSVTLNFKGEGKRNVRVGYIQESPIWKTSYRLVLDKEKAPFLQGWAIVENTTEEDWKEVDLTLVSGRPISYVMNLYDPLYVTRPVVEPELYASLRPQTYGGDLAMTDKEALGQAISGPAPPAAADLAARSSRFNRGVESLERTPARGRSGGGRMGRELAEGEDYGMSLGEGVESAAKAADVGELFSYAIGTPVTLARQQSAMLPIVNESVVGKKLSIYNANVHPKHPLNGLRLKNSTTLHIMQGPVTVFDGGTYAGDAKIEDLQPGSERLISYAMDLDVEVAPEQKGHSERLVSVSIVKGVIETKRKHMRERKYTIKNSGDAKKDLLLEQGFESGWTLVTPKEPTEKTRDNYRFAVAAEPGKPTTFNVVEEQIFDQQVALTNIDDGTIILYIRAKEVSAEVKAALQEVLKRKTALQELIASRQKLEQQIATVEQEQNRIRQNMERLDRNSELYNRYVKKFGEQEDQVEELRKQILALGEKETEQRRSLDQYIAGVTLA